MREEQELKYQSMFKPNLSPSGTPSRAGNISKCESTENEYHLRDLVRGMERSEDLYRRGIVKQIKRVEGLSVEEQLMLERSYDENLTFQPVINKGGLKSANESMQASDKHSASESRKKRIDELSRKVTSPAYAMRRDSKMSSDMFEK